MYEFNAHNIPEVLTHVKSISKEWAPDPKDKMELWFRGQSKARYNLLPGLFRNEIKVFHYDEETLQERFKANAAPFTNIKLEDTWSWYFLSQHHGIPTRLLDWTENLLAAIYFALEGYYKACDRRNYEPYLYKPQNTPVFDLDSPSIWIIDPGALNLISWGAGNDFVIVPGETKSNKYLPVNISIKCVENRYPIAILPPHTNNRIVAQQGLFTLHGYELQSIESVLNMAATHPQKIARILLDKANLPFFWEELEIMGINRLSLFPDADSAAHCVKWDCQNIEI